MQEVADMLDRLDDLGASRERVTVDDVQACLGRDAFGPALLTLGLLALSPVGDIPGAPTILAIFIFGVGAQMAAGRNRPWLPRALARRSVRGRHLCRAASLFRPVVRVLAAVIWARLTFLTEGLFARAIAGTCAILALTLPPLEFVPFGATVPSSVISGLSIALVARDGLLALISFALMIAGGFLILSLVG
ncbi:MAG: exopolysaccharide biosynthesis protein [Guyparkeria sp.]